MKNFLKLFFLLMYFTSSAQFPNVGFENVLCSASDCSQSASTMACVVGWEAYTNIAFPQPLQKQNICNETVCSGNYAVKLNGNSGSGLSIITDNPFTNIDGIPQVVTLDANVDPISDPGTGIGISGITGSNYTSYDHKIPSAYGVCESLTFLLPGSVENETKINFAVGLETSHLDKHIAIVDNIDICGDLFLINENCGILNIDLNDECASGLGIENLLVEVTFPGSPFNLSELPFELELTGNIEHTINYYIVFENGDFQHLTTTFTATTVGENCCDESLVCSVQSDLNACVYEEDFGFIQVSCDANTDLTFYWQFPINSTALLSNGPGQSTVVQASPGTYNLVVLDETNCSEEYSFVVEEDCCEEMTCATPENLWCGVINGEIVFSWDPVIGAAGYQLYIIMNDPDCCDGWPAPYSLLPIKTTTNTFTLQDGMHLGCYSWRVKALCGPESQSALSDKLCYYHSQCYDPVAVRGSIQENPSQKDLKPKIYPNPTKGEMNFEFEAEDNLTISIDIYSSDGKLIQTIGEQTFSDGSFKTKWTPTQPLADGIYYVFFNTNQGVFHEKIVVTNNNSKI